ncbi:hypothetical protein ACFE04_014336 [Oxalis oulophora]
MESSTSTTNSKNPTKKPKEIKIYVVQDGEKTQFKLRVNTSFKKLIEVYCERKQINSQLTSFLFVGNRINVTQTPEIYAITGGSLLALPIEQRRFKLAVVDLSQDLNKYLAIHYNISTDPTIKIFRDRGNIIEDYIGPLDYKGMFHCLQRLSAPSLPQVHHLEDVNSILKNNILNNKIVVGAFLHLHGPEYENFLQVAKRLKWDYDFYTHCLPASETSLQFVRAYYSLDDYSLKNNYDSRQTDNFDVDTLVEFIKDSDRHFITASSFTDPHYHPHYDPFLISDFFHSDKENDKALLLIKYGDVDVKAFTSEYNRIAKKYRFLGINFMLGELDNCNTDLMDVSSLASGARTHIFIIRKPSGEIYMKSDFHDIDAWLKDFKLGRLTRYRISEPNPQRNDEPVEVVDAWLKDFDDIDVSLL